MPYLTVEGGLSAETGQPFAAILCDDGRERRPVTAVRASEHWLKVGERDWREITSSFAGDGRVTFFILPSRLGVAEKIRAQRLGEARAAALALQAALGKLDPADKGRAKMLIHQLGHWLETPNPRQSQPLPTERGLDRRVRRACRLRRSVPRAHNPNRNWSALLQNMCGTRRREPMTDIIAQVRAAVHHWHDSDSGDSFRLIQR